MRNGIRIPAPVVWLVTLVGGALAVVIWKHEYPEIRRYLNAERM